MIVSVLLHLVRVLCIAVYAPVI